MGATGWRKASEAISIAKVTPWPGEPYLVSSAGRAAGDTHRQGVLRRLWRIAP